MSAVVPPSPPTDRYGRSGGGLTRGRKIAIAVALVLAVAFAGWLALAQFMASPVQADVVSFRVTSAEEIQIDFQVSMSPGTKAVCTVTALASDFSEVGTKQVPVGPARTDTARYTVTLRTSQKADSGVIDGCTRG
ncbi:MAG: DUF4307 domain-containing protein [Promicromonosporaceae bacterium]|nr:DUF4307 domain-containing protein [Promicromonosporaceae bacterium]